MKAYSIDGYELIPDGWGYADKINNILVANNINRYRIQIAVRYNYTIVYWMWVPFGDTLHIDGAIKNAVDALQNKFGPDLPVYNNYAEAKNIAAGLLTTSQAAKRLEVNTSRIRQLIAAGRIKAIKQGRDWMIEASELDGYERGKSGRPKREIVDNPPHTSPAK
jgi:excisionase family DNA binding protein